MTSFIKERILATKNPDNYYGSSVCIENLKVGDSIYIGHPAVVQALVVEEIIFDFAYKKYEVHTSTCIFTVMEGSRVNCKLL